MIKNLTKWASIAATVLLAISVFASCDELEEKGSLSISPSSAQSVAAAGETLSVTVTSNTSWSVSGAQDWCTVSPSAGEGDEIVTIVVSANESEDSRSATLTFSTDDANASASLKISQAGVEASSEEPSEEEEESIFPYLLSAVAGDLNSWGAWLEDWTLGGKLTGSAYYVVVNFNGYTSIASGDEGEYTATPQIKLCSWDLDWNCVQIAYLDGYYVGDGYVWCYELTAEQINWINTNGGIACQGTNAVIVSVYITEEACESSEPAEEPEEEGSEEENQGEEGGESEGEEGGEGEGEGEGEAEGEQGGSSSEIESTERSLAKGVVSSWGASDWEYLADVYSDNSGKASSSFDYNGLYYTEKSGKTLNFGQTTITIDEVPYTYWRAQLGGGNSTSASGLCLSVYVVETGTLSFTIGSSGDARTLNLEVNSEIVTSYDAVSSSVLPVSYSYNLSSLSAETAITIYSTSGNINVYEITWTPDSYVPGAESEEPSTGEGEQEGGSGDSEDSDSSDGNTASTSPLTGVEGGSY